jgi:hypothetical protein
MEATSLSSAVSSFFCIYLHFPDFLLLSKASDSFSAAFMYRLDPYTLSDIL